MGSKRQSARHIYSNSALCFEAACVGSLAYLQKTGHVPTERTARADATYYLLI
jgi:hypothetical protein